MHAGTLCLVFLLLVYQEGRILLDLEGAWDALLLGQRLLLPGMLIGLTLLLGGRLGWLFLTFSATITAIILVGNQASLTYFNRPLNFAQSSAAGQLWQIRDSVAAAIGLQGAIIVLATVVLAVLGLRRKPGSQNRRLGAGILCLCSIGLSLAWFSVPAQQSPYALTKSHGALLSHLLQVRDQGNEASTTALSNSLRQETIRTALARKALLNRRSSPFFGLAKDRNVILFEMEAFQSFVLGLKVPGGEVTPNLNRLAAGGLTWQGAVDISAAGRSSDAEFAVMTSQLPHPQKPVAMEHFPQEWTTMPKLLKEQGYKTLSLHAFRSSFWNRDHTHPSYGIDDMRFQGSFKPGRTIGWGLCDEDFLLQSAGILAQVAEPFYAFHITLTSHHPFNKVPEELATWPVGPVGSNMLADYLRLMHYTDAAVGKWLGAMQESGQLQRSLIVFYGDHDAGLHRQARMAAAKLTGRDFSQPGSNRILLLMAVPGEEEFIQANRQASAHTLGALHDIAPTVMHLLGQQSPLGFFGTHLFVTPEHRDPLPLPGRRSLVHEGKLLALAEAEKMGKVLASAKQQTDIARMLIEHKGQTLVREQRDADEEILRRLAAGSLHTETLHAGSGRESEDEQADGLSLMPLIEVPEGEMAQATGISGMPPKFIAHGGGITEGLMMTNSLQALNASARLNYQLIEVDLVWTNDGHLVLLHDWQHSMQSLFGRQPSVMDLAGFRQLDSPNKLTHLSLADLMDWLDQHPDLRIVTDIKAENVRGLQHIAKQYPEHQHRFVPQIYHRQEYQPVKQLGYDDIIFTLYLAKLSDQAVVSFAEQNPLYAITMPIARALRELPRKLGEKDIFTYTHPVNEDKRWKTLRAKGIDGVYTDRLGLGPREGLQPPVLADWQFHKSEALALGFHIIPFVPPPRFAWEFGPELTLHNPSTRAGNQRLEVWSKQGKQQERTLPVQAGGSCVIWLRQLFRRDSGWVKLQSDGMNSQAWWGIEEQSRFPLEVERNAHRRFQLEGPAAGLAGHAIAMVNPLTVAATANISRQVDDKPSERIQVTLPPNSQSIRFWQVQPGEKQISLEITGDPIVLQPFRWDPKLLIMR